jgi:hypothetical protein
MPLIDVWTCEELSREELLKLVQRSDVVPSWRDFRLAKEKEIKPGVKVFVAWLDYDGIIHYPTEVTLDEEPIQWDKYFKCDYVHYTWPDGMKCFVPKSDFFGDVSEDRRSPIFASFLLVKKG